MRQLAVAWVLCAFAGAAAAQAPQQAPQAPSAKPQGDAGRDKAAAQPQSAPPAPVIVNVQPPAKTEAEAQKEEAERQEKAHLDRRLVELTGDLADYTRWLAYATFALFAVTAGLFAFAIRQARDARESGQAARESAEAAKRSADATERALYSVDAPYLTASVTGLGRRTEHGADGFKSREAISISVTNHGRSAAVALERGFVCDTDIAVKPVIIYGETHGQLIQPIDVRSGETQRIFVVDYDSIDPSRFAPDRRVPPINVAGYARYRDIFGRNNIVCFCFYYEATSKKYYELGGEERNFCRPMTEAETAIARTRSV